MVKLINVRDLPIQTGSWEFFKGFPKIFDESLSFTDKHEQMIPQYFLQGTFLLPSISVTKST